MREFMKAKEEESARTQETLHVIQQQLEQLLSTVEAHNGWLFNLFVFFLFF